MGFSERLFELRSKHNESQETFGAKIGVSRQAVSKWETGEANPDIKYIVKISECYDVTTDWLLTGKDQISKEIDLPLPPNTETQAYKKMFLKALYIILIVGGIALVLFLLTLGFSLIPNK